MAGAAGQVGAGGALHDDGLVQAQGGDVEDGDGVAVRGGPHGRGARRHLRGQVAVERGLAVLFLEPREPQEVRGEAGEEHGGQAQGTAAYRIARCAEVGAQVGAAAVA